MGFFTSFRATKNHKVNIWTKKGRRIRASITKTSKGAKKPLTAPRYRSHLHPLSRGR